MIYIRTKNGQHLLILEPNNLERLKNGEPLTTIDSAVFVAYCPDVPWLTDELLKHSANEFIDFDQEVIDRLLKEGILRHPVKEPGPYYPVINLRAKKGEA